MRLGGGRDTAEVFVCAEGSAVAVWVEGGAGVDLGLVGRTLGLDPSSVRLNGHYLSRGPDLVSSSVTWDALLRYFAARGLPAGAANHDPIRVQGKPSPFPHRHVEDGCLSLKRKVGVEDETPVKRNKAAQCSLSEIEVGGEQVSDEDCLSIKRKLRLEDDRLLKKKRTSEAISGFADDALKPPKINTKTGFTYNCISDYGKRLREDEVATGMSCKRIK